MSVSANKSEIIFQSSLVQGAGGIPLTRKQFVNGFVATLGGLFLPANAFGTGTPIMKFGLVSDVHLGGEGKDADLEKVLRFFDAQGVDAVMIPGDFAHTGLIKEFERLAAVWYRVFPDDRGADGRKVEKLFVTGNHCIDGWAGRWKGWSEDQLRDGRFNYADNPQKTWRRLFHEDWHDIFLKIVKGVPFIGAQWKSKLAPFVEPPIAATVAKLAPTFDSNLPFFFFQHNPPDRTCHGRAGDKVLREALSPYPNAVAITGHTHESISDDRSVWQGSFTSIGAGCMHEAGAGLDYRNVNYGWHVPSRQKAMRLTEWIPQGGCFTVVDVFADHLVLHRRSVMFDEPLGEDWAVPLPAAQGSGFDFKVRKSRMIAPEFAPGAKVTVTYCPKGHPEQAKRYAGEPCVAVDFPPASTPRGVVREYEVAARFEGGPEIVRAKVIPNGFGLAKSRMNIPGTCLFRTCELAGARPIVFSVTAGECFGKKGRPIESVPFSYRKTAIGPSEPMRLYLTFDDGIKEHLHIAAEELEKRGWRGIFCIVTGAIGKPRKLTWDDVRELQRRGHVIANHTRRHRGLGSLCRQGKSEEARTDILEGAAAIEHETGVRPKLLCLPGTDGHGLVTQMAREAGMTTMLLPRLCFGEWDSDVGRKIDDLRRRGTASADFLVHGITKGGGGWRPFATRADFVKFLEGIRAAEQAGKVTITTDYRLN